VCVKITNGQKLALPGQQFLAECATMLYVHCLSY